VHGLDIVEGKINNDDVSVLRDTGCSTVFVHSKFTNTDLVYVHSVLASLALKENLLQYVLLSDK
jgi:hypothetical protein